MSIENKKRGRKEVFTNDVAVTLSVKVPSKQKELFRDALLAMRKPFEIKK